MKKKIRNLWVAIMVLFTVAPVAAQDDTPPHIRKEGYYTLGINTGFSYLSSDVRNVYDGYGVGMTLAKNLYYRPGAPIAFDVRGRLLYDESYGLDHKRSFGIENNDALNGTGKLDYTLDSGESGFVYNNFQTRMVELGLEGVIHFNRLREKTRFDLSIYGGIGLDWYKVKTDQLKNGATYSEEYAAMSSDLTKSTIRTQLKNSILDGVYETNAHDFKKGGKLGLMPGVGFDLEYNLTKRFSIGVGHKITFPRHDNLDGQIWNDDNTATAENDLHHYTNLDFRWILQPRKKQLPEPIIDITEPKKSPYTARYCDGEVRATIKHIRNAADVEFRVNGSPTPYSFSGTKFSADFPLAPGKNEVTIYARNSVGSDSETVILFCEERTLPPEPTVRAPRVKITSPSYDDFRTQETYITIKADIDNIAASRDIEFLVNGYRIDFDYNARTGRFSSEVNLTKGNNEVIITARNPSGQDTDNRRIIVETKEIRYPSVEITSPTANPYNTSSSKVNIRANTKDIDSKSDIDFYINDRASNNFTFDSSKGRIESSVNLNQGSNKIRIRVKNARGEAADETKVIYVVEQNDVDDPAPDGRRPKVEITKPGTSTSNTSSTTESIKAFVRDVDSKSDIRMTLNGSNFSNFTYNQNSEILIASVPLTMGRNTIRITATNSYGTDADDVIIRRISDVGTIDKKPDVDFTKPNNNSTTTTATQSVKAKVKNVAGKEEIKLTLNGSNISNFSYNTLTRDLTATVTLKSGSNTLKIVATNNGGTDSDVTKVTYNAVQKPNVSISSPKANAKVSSKTVTLKSKVTNVNSKNDVKVLLNGKSVPSFNYSNGNVTSTLTLKNGKNIIKVTGTNSAGSDSETKTVQYDAQAPKITIITPTGKTAKKPSASLKAKVEHVKSKSDIKVQLNGRSLRNFSYSTSTKILTANLTLKEGTNNLVIVAVNEAGTTDKKLDIKYMSSTIPALKKPIITINSIGQPTADPFDPGPLKSTILVTLKYVTKKSQIALRINGNNTNDFTFDTKNGTLRHTFYIKDGSNSIRIEATNSTGTTLVTKNHNF